MSIERVGRRFYLNRLVDVSGISGTGPVADGVEFSDHVCVIHWRNYRSTSIYRNAEDMMLSTAMTARQFLSGSIPDKTFLH